MDNYVQPASPSFAARARYARYSSPVGELLIVGDDLSLKSLAFRGASQKLHPIERALGKGETRPIAACRAFLDCYFGRSLRVKSVILEKQSARYDDNSSILYITAPGLTVPIDCSAFTRNECTVYAELASVRFGSTISYAALASRSGFPGGARFIGNTMGKNSVPILIPCHRVIRSDGAIGNYTGGVGIKRSLLDLELSRL